MLAFALAKKYDCCECQFPFNRQTSLIQESLVIPQFYFRRKNILLIYLDSLVSPIMHHPCLFAHVPIDELAPERPINIIRRISNSLFIVYHSNLITPDRRATCFIFNHEIRRITLIF